MLLRKRQTLQGYLYKSVTTTSRNRVYFVNMKFDLCMQGHNSFKRGLKMLGIASQPLCNQAKLSFYINYMR